MLMVLRSVLLPFAADGVSDAALTVGTAGVEIEDALTPGRAGSDDDTVLEDNMVGNWDAKEPRRESGGVRALLDGGDVGDSLRDLDSGKDGRGVFGGPSDGRGGLGRVVVMVVMVVMSWCVQRARCSTIDSGGEVVVRLLTLRETAAGEA